MREESKDAATGVQIEVIPWLTDLLEEHGSGRARWREGIEPGDTVGALIARLHRSHARLAEAVFNLEEGHLTGLVNLLLNDRALELAGGVDAVLRDGDRLTLIPAYAGG